MSLLRKILETFFLSSEATKLKATKKHRKIINKRTSLVIINNNSLV